MLRIEEMIIRRWNILALISFGREVPLQFAFDLYHLLHCPTIYGTHNRKIQFEAILAAALVRTCYTAAVAMLENRQQLICCCNRVINQKQCLPRERSLIRLVSSTGFTLLWNNWWAKTIIHSLITLLLMFLINKLFGHLPGH